MCNSSNRCGQPIKSILSAAVGTLIFLFSFALKNLDILQPFVSSSDFHPTDVDMADESCSPDNVDEPWNPIFMRRVSCLLQVTGSHTTISLPPFLISFYQTKMGTAEAKVPMLLLLDLKVTNNVFNT